VDHLFNTRLKDSVHYYMEMFNVQTSNAINKCKSSMNAMCETCQEYADSQKGNCKYIPWTIARIFISA